MREFICFFLGSLYPVIWYYLIKYLNKEAKRQIEAGETISFVNWLVEG